MTTEGNRDISAQEYIGYTNDFGADSFVTLNDEVPLSVGKRRGKQSVIRNKNWLQQHLNEATGSSGIIANIQATENEQLLKEQLDLINQNAGKLLGVHVSGLHLGESPKQREAMLTAIFSSIPEDLVRFVTGPDSPSEILESVRLGVDVTVSSYPIRLAEKAYCSTHSLLLGLTIRYWNGKDGCVENKTKMDVMDVVYEHDKSPLVPGCSCYACQKFTKGYLHHLFNCHELLGIILL